MSASGWREVLSEDARSWSHHSETHSGSRAEQREQSRADAAWSEDIETAVYGEQDYTLPGMESRPSGCGDWYPREFCGECGEPQFAESRCQNRGCPECWHGWTRKRAEKITRRLGAARYVEDGARKRAVHAVASPPEGSVKTKQQFYSALKEAYALAKRKGVRGGVCIPHGYRLTDEAKAEYRKADYEGGAWKWVREESATHWRSLTYWSPHFHILGLAEDVGENKPHEQGGWVFERLRSLKRFQLHQEGGYDDMVAASRYLLSHATYEIDESKQVVRWFGALAPAAFSPEEEVSSGALDVIERMAKEVAGSGLEPDEASEGQLEEETCDRESCSGELHPIWDAGEALMNESFCESIGPEQENRLRVAFEWAVGDLDPPPGLKRPRSERECREAFEALL